MEDLPIPEPAELRQTLRRLGRHVHNTPVLTSRLLNELAGCELYFKSENFQKAGAFKFRGALNAVLLLSEEEMLRGVATHSSGNHAQALALAARLNGSKAYIVMPRTAPQVKRQATAGYGGRITLCEPTLAAREQTLKQVVHDTGAVVIHPYDNHQVICGQSTVAQELLAQVRELEALVAPVGGGGLLSGTALAAAYSGQQVAVYGAEPAGAADAHESLQQGRLIPSQNPQTLADGLLTSLSPRTWQIISRYAADILLADDGQIKEAMRLVWERLKIVVEPSAAVPLAAVLAHRQTFAGQKVGIILSGGNVDVSRFIDSL